MSEQEFMDTVNDFYDSASKRLAENGYKFTDRDLIALLWLKRKLKELKKISKIVDEYGEWLAYALNENKEES